MQINNRRFDHDVGVVRCACGLLYEFYNMFCGCQSMCPGCRVRQQRELELAKRDNWGLEPDSQRMLGDQNVLLNSA